MTNKEKKQIKKLYGFYKNCINATSFNKNTKSFRERIKEKMNLISNKTNVPIGSSI